MNAFVSEINRKAESSVSVSIDVRRWLIAVLIFFPYALALAFGCSVRVTRYAVAALQVGYHEGLNGRTRDKPKE